MPVVLVVGVVDVAGVVVAIRVALRVVVSVVDAGDVLARVVRHVLSMLLFVCCYRSCTQW